MKKRNATGSFLLIIVLFLVVSCKTETTVKNEIQNNLKSISYLQDTLGYDLIELKASFEAVNKTIEEIGYPDAGYELWVINKDSSDISFMIQGSWPDMETYKKIHESESYKETTKGNEEFWAGLKTREYHRFTRVE